MRVCLFMFNVHIFVSVLSSMYILVLDSDACINFKPLTFSTFYCHTETLQLTFTYSSDSKL